MRISIRKPHKLTSKWHKSRIICNFFARKFVNTLKISKLSILESEKETAIEKAGVKVVTNYENLIENYQPALNELVQAATEIDTILFKYAEAQQRFNKVYKIKSIFYYIRIPMDPGTVGPFRTNRSVRRFFGEMFGPIALLKYFRKLAGQTGRSLVDPALP